MMSTSATFISKEICRNYIEEFLFGPTNNPNIDQRELPGSIGVELESFPYAINADGGILPVQLYGNNDSLMNVLVHHSALKGGIPQYAFENAFNDKQSSIIAAIDFPEGSSFHFEPGAQIEISTALCDSIGMLSDKIHFMQQILQEISKQTNFHFLQCGTSPWFSVDQIGMQMNKPRYRAMSSYFDNLNTFGRQMMLQTCSLQINMDAGSDWDTRTKRFFAANLLAPFATALFAHSPVIAGKVNGYKSYRSFIWQQLDTSRTGVITTGKAKSIFDKEVMIDAYLNFALKAPVIFIEEFRDEIFPPNITLEYWINHGVKGLQPTLSHLKNHLSLLFPEVRLKGYLELRSVDASPPEWQMVPVLFYCGLLYSNDYLDKTLDLLMPFEDNLQSLMEQAVFGLESDVIFETAGKLMPLAVEGFSVLPESFQDKKILDQAISFSEKFTLQRRTFADIYLEDFRKKKIL